MREADKAECRAYNGMDPYEALADSRERSEGHMEVWHGADLLCEWGYRTDSFLSQTASAWMLSFAPMERHKVFAARQSLSFLKQLLERYRTVRCIVSVEHGLAQRWLLWLGFQVESVFVAPGGGTFYGLRIDRGGELSWAF